MPREGHGSRNKKMKNGAIVKRPSCPARGMGVEIPILLKYSTCTSRSCPARGMGVEIVRTVGNYIYRKSCPARGMGVEISGACLKWRHPWSCPARGMGVEMFMNQNYRKRRRVMPREGHGSRNLYGSSAAKAFQVMPREGHGSRNYDTNIACLITNLSCPAGGMGVEIRALCNALHTGRRHAPRGAWE